MQKEKRTCEDTARGSHVQAKEKGLRRNKPAKHLDLKRLASRPVGK